MMRTKEPQRLINGHDEFLLIKKDDKFFSRLLSKEKSTTSIESASFRFYYYGDSSKGSIPFRWESRPGTPKHALADVSGLPPLTPPPSHRSSAAPSSVRRRSSGGHVLRSFFSKIKWINRSNVSPPRSVVSSSSCSSSFSQPSSAASAVALARRSRRTRSETHLRLEEIFGDFDDDDDGSSRSSSSTFMCFGATSCRSWMCLNNNKI